jgi:hypothetical protein
VQLVPPGAHEQVPCAFTFLHVNIIKIGRIIKRETTKKSDLFTDFILILTYKRSLPSERLLTQQL